MDVIFSAATSKRHELIGELVGHTEHRAVHDTYLAARPRGQRSDRLIEPRISRSSCLIPGWRN
jgi:hypothetical protein